MMAEKRTVPAKEVLQDIRAGMSDAELMRKYNLSAAGLRSLFDKLLEANLVTRELLDKRLTSSEQTIELSADALDQENILAGREEKFHEVLGDLVTRFSFSKNDLERLKTASSRDLGELLSKYNIPVSEWKDLLKTYGSQPGELISRAKARISSMASGSQDQTISEDRASTPSESILSDDVHKTAESEGKLAPGETREKTTDPLQPRAAGETLAMPGAGEAPADAGTVSHTQENAKDPVDFDKLYNNPIFVVIALLCCFPLGFYALYRNSSLSTKTKAIIIGAWILLLAFGLTLDKSGKVTTEQSKTTSEQSPQTFAESPEATLCELLKAGMDLLPKCISESGGDEGKIQKCYEKFKSLYGGTEVGEVYLRKMDEAVACIRRGDTAGAKRRLLAAEALKHTLIEKCQTEMRKAYERGKR